MDIEGWGSSSAWGLHGVQGLSKDYEILDRIGEGSFGEVHRGKRRSDGLIVALKQSYHPQSSCRELEALRRLDHPNIVKLLDYYVQGSNFVLVLEYLPTNLCEEIQSLTGKVGNRPQIEEAVIKGWMVQILQGVAACHSASILHRDLKPSNILFAADGTPKIADFGQARIIREIVPLDTEKEVQKLDEKDCFMSRQAGALKSVEGQIENTVQSNGSGPLMGKKESCKNDTEGDASLKFSVAPNAASNVDCGLCVGKSMEQKRNQIEVLSEDLASFDLDCHYIQEVASSKTTVSSSGRSHETEKYLVWEEPESLTDTFCEGTFHTAAVDDEFLFKSGYGVECHASSEVMFGCNSTSPQRESDLFRKLGSFWKKGRRFWLKQGKVAKKDSVFCCNRDICTMHRNDLDEQTESFLQKGYFETDLTKRDFTSMVGSNSKGSSPLQQKKTVGVQASAFDSPECVSRIFYETETECICERIVDSENIYTVHVCTLKEKAEGGENGSSSLDCEGVLESPYQRREDTNWWTGDTLQETAHVGLSANESFPDTICAGAHEYGGNEGTECSMNFQEAKLRCEIMQGGETDMGLTGEGDSVEVLSIGTGIIEEMSQDLLEEPYPHGQRLLEEKELSAKAFPNMQVVMEEVAGPSNYGQYSLKNILSRKDENSDNSAFCVRSSSWDGTVKFWDDGQQVLEHECRIDNTQCIKQDVEEDRYGKEEILAHNLCEQRWCGCESGGEQDGHGFNSEAVQHINGSEGIEETQWYGFSNVKELHIEGEYLALRGKLLNEKSTEGEMCANELVDIEQESHYQDSLFEQEVWENGTVIEASQSQGSNVSEDTASEFSSCIGTRWYRAPELLYGATNYGRAVDMWALGCIFAELIGKKALLAGTTDIEQLCKVVRLLGSPDENNWPGVSQLPDYDKISFVENSPVVSLQEQLPTASDAFCKFIGNFLNYNPTSRLSAMDALKDEYFSVEPLPLFSPKLRFPSLDGNGELLGGGFMWKESGSSLSDFEILE